MAHDVFISYANEDKHVAELVAKALETQNIKCWYAPRDIPVGVDYEEAIVDGICDSQLVVLILSSHSNMSPHVRREIQNANADDVGRPILPMRIDETPLHKALRYYLGSSQWLDASTPPVESHLQLLVDQVRPRLRRPVLANEESLIQKRKREEEKDELKPSSMSTEAEQHHASRPDVVINTTVPAIETVGARSVLLRSVTRLSATTQTLIIVLSTLVLIIISLVIVYIIYASGPGGMKPVSESIGEFTPVILLFLVFEAAIVYLNQRSSGFRHWSWWLFGAFFVLLISLFIAAWNDALKRRKILPDSYPSELKKTFIVIVTNKHGEPVGNVGVALTDVDDRGFSRFFTGRTNSSGGYVFTDVRPRGAQDVHIEPPDGFEELSETPSEDGTSVNIRIDRKTVISPK